MRKLGIVMAMVLGLWGCNPFKVTDPSDPRFDPTKFSFEDYKTEEEFQEALIKLFPIGTSRSKVDEILLSYAQTCHSNEIPGNKISLSNNRKPLEKWNNSNFFIEYMNPQKPNSDRVWIIAVLFDGKERKVVDVMSNIIGPAAFPKSIGSEVRYPKWDYHKKTCSQKGD